MRSQSSTEQIENIQVLWREQQSELEKQKLKNSIFTETESAALAQTQWYRSELSDLRVLTDSAKPSPSNDNPASFKANRSLLAEIESGSA